MEVITFSLIEQDSILNKVVDKYVYITIHSFIYKIIVWFH